jgi:hypothetical protein
MKATTLWTITLEDNRIFKIACKKKETAVNKIQRYYLKSDELLCHKSLKDIYEKEQPETKWISFSIDGTGILTI